MRQDRSGSWLERIVSKHRKRKLDMSTKVSVKIDLGYTIPSDQQPPLNVPSKISEMLIRGALNAKYPNGSKDRIVQRNVASLFNVLDKAIKSGSSSFEITRDIAEAVLLDAIKDWSAPIGMASWIVDMIDALTDSIESSKKTPQAQTQS